MGNLHEIPGVLAYRPTTPPQKPKPGKKLALVILAFAAIAAAYYTFDDFVQEDDAGTLSLRETRQEAVQQKIDKNNEQAEQYVLIARADGLYPCKKCPGGQFFLLKGEIAKVGTTVNGSRGRYPPNFLEDNRLDYIKEYQGDIREALNREIMRIASYPLLPENLNRPVQPTGGIPRYRLGRPPMNEIDR